MEVILSCFEPCEPFGSLTDGIPVAMLPVLNKPIIEHLLEQTIDADVSRISVATVEHPRSARQFLGRGERWGIEIQVISFKDACSDWDLLKRFSSDSGEPILLIPAETLIDLELGTVVEFHTASGNRRTKVLASGDNDDLKDSVTGATASGRSPQRASVDTGIVVASAPFEQTEPIGEFIFSGDWIRVGNPVQLWEANQKAVSGRFPLLRRSATVNKNGQWFGHHCAIHTSATIAEPVFVGNHTRIGSGAEVLEGSVIGDGAIVDANATVRSSVVMDHTYVGSFTNVEGRIVRGRYVFNVRTGSTIEVADPIILSGARERTFGPATKKIVERLIATLLFLSTSPLWMAKGLIRIVSGKRFFHKKEFSLCAAWQHISPSKEIISVSLRSFGESDSFISRLPGLLDVMAGRLSLVGTRPLTEHERASLPGIWTDLRDSAPSGLFTPVDAEDLSDPSEEEMLVVENYYAATRSTGGDFRVLLKSIFNLAFRR